MSDTKQSQPLIPWPNEESVRNTIMAIIASEQGDPGTQGRWLDETGTQALAPGIMDAIRREMGEYDMPERLLQDLDEEQDFIARNVLRKMDPAHREALARRFREDRDE